MRNSDRSRDGAREKREKKYQNLIPNSERSPEELREMGRKGGIRSGESRRRKRDREKKIKMMVEIIAENPEVKARMSELVEFFWGE